MEIYNISKDIEKIVFSKNGSKDRKEFFCITVDDGFGDENPKYYFRVRWSSRYITKVGKRGGKARISQRYAEFHAVGYTTNSEEIDTLWNSEKVSVGIHEMYIPKIWYHKTKEINENHLNLCIDFSGDFNPDEAF